MSISLRCPKCRKEYKVADDKAGARLKCRECQQIFRVPSVSPDPEFDAGDDEDDSPAPTRPLRTPRRPAPRKVSAKKPIPVALWIGVGVGAFVFIGGAIGALVLLNKSGAQSDSAAKPEVANQRAAQSNDSPPTTKPDVASSSPAADPPSPAPETVAANEPGQNSATTTPPTTATPPAEVTPRMRKKISLARGRSSSSEPPAQAGTSGANGNSYALVETRRPTPMPAAGATPDGCDPLLIYEVVQEQETSSGSKSSSTFRYFTELEFPWVREEVYARIPPRGYLATSQPVEVDWQGKKVAGETMTWSPDPDSRRKRDYEKATILRSDAIGLPQYFFYEPGVALIPIPAGAISVKLVPKDDSSQQSDRSSVEFSADYVGPESFSFGGRNIDAHSFKYQCRVVKLNQYMMGGGANQKIETRREETLIEGKYTISAEMPGAFCSRETVGGLGGTETIRWRLTSATPAGTPPGSELDANGGFGMSPPPGFEKSSPEKGEICRFQSNSGGMISIELLDSEGLSAYDFFQTMLSEGLKRDPALMENSFEAGTGPGHHIAGCEMYYYDSSRDKTKLAVIGHRGQLYLIKLTNPGVDSTQKIAGLFDSLRWMTDFHPTSPGNAAPFASRQWARIPATAGFEARTAGLNGVAFSPDGRQVVVAYGEYIKDIHTDSVRIWDIASGKQVARVNTAPHAGITYSPDGKSIVVTFFDKLSFLDPKTLAVQREFSLGHITAPGSIQFFSEAKQVLLLPNYLHGNRKLARLSLVEGQEATLVQIADPKFDKFDPRSGYTRIVQLPDEKTCVGIGQTEGLKDFKYFFNVFDLESGTSIRTIDIGVPRGRDDNSGVVYEHLVALPDGKTVIIGGLSGDLVAWDVETGLQVYAVRPLKRTTDDIDGMALSPDGTLLAISGDDSGTVQLLDSRTGKFVSLLVESKHLATGDAGHIAFSRDGRKVAATFGQEQPVLVWNISSIPSRKSE